jgi:7-cyano-7-deazaguanine synthase
MVELDKSGEKMAVALISGGMDSAVAGGLAREAGYGIYALSFDYGQRHRVELEAAGRVAAWLEAVEHTVIRVELEKIGGSALTDDIAVPKDRSGSEIPSTYVPARNIIFLSIALSLAEAAGADRIVIGINAIDFSGYPDCRPEFIEAFQRVAEIGTRMGVEGRAPMVWAPLIDLSKAEIVKEGMRLGLDFGITSSCYDPGPDGEPCGRCDACRLREKGFSRAGATDPLVKDR